LGSLEGRTGTETPYAMAAIVRAVPGNFKPGPAGDEQILFDPKSGSSPIVVSSFVPGSSTETQLTFDFSSTETKKGIIFDSHTFLYVMMEQCGFSFYFNANDTKFALPIVDSNNEVKSDLTYHGSGVLGSFIVSNRQLKQSELYSAGMKREFSRSDYYDDICTCNMGVPDLACQNPEIGPANAEGCAGTEMCVVDMCIAGVKGSKDISCPYHDQHFGNDNVCQCGCIGESNLPDIDCYYPNRYALVTPDSNLEMIADFHGVTGKCTEKFPDVKGEEWTCPVEMYDDGKTCECFCGYMDPDCLNTTLPTDCHEDFICALTNSSNLTSQTCLAPKGWNCDPNMYNMTGAYFNKKTCYCNCSLNSPGCLRNGINSMFCAPSKSVVIDRGSYKCLANGTCLSTPCGDGLNAGHFRKCDGGTYCIRCSCDQKYKSTIPPTNDCHPACGDTFVVDGEECDGSPFCDNQTCTCLPGHDWETGPSKHGHCGGCGNQIRDKGEECDGGEGCLSSCTCDELGGYSPSDKADATSCQKTSQSVPIIIGGSIGAVVLIVSIVILFIIVNHYKTDEQKATRKVRQSENAIKSAKSQNSKITFDSKSALNPQPRSAGPDPSIIAQLNVSTQGGGMLDEEDD